MANENPGFTSEMEFATRVGAVAIAMLSAVDMQRALTVILGREAEFPEVMRAAEYNIDARAAADLMASLRNTPEIVDRRSLYEEFWRYQESDLAAYSRTIQDLLRHLTDAQLEKLVAERRGEAGDED